MYHLQTLKHVCNVYHYRLALRKNIEAIYIYWYSGYCRVIYSVGNESDSGTDQIRFHLCVCSW